MSGLMATAFIESCYWFVIFEFMVIHVLIVVAFPVACVLKFINAIVYDGSMMAIMFGWVVLSFVLAAGWWVTICYYAGVVLGS